MLRLFFLCIIPAAFALLLCYLVGNAIPALVVGGVCSVMLVLGLRAMFKDLDSGSSSDGMALVAVGGLIVLPSAINAVLLLGGSGVYYLARYLGG
jgi:hypothetical protein